MNKESTTDDTTRIDRWLWAVRVYKTRSDATRACVAGHVELGDRTVKAAQHVSIGDRVTARVGPRERILEVTRIIDKRVGAAVAAGCYVDHSPPPPETSPDVAFGAREPGTGRPTKRDRRQMERHLGRRGQR